MKHFDEHPAAQAWYELNATHTYGKLVSYSTTVLELVNGILYVNGLYSATTRKHIGWFMRELGMTYQDAKRAYEHDGMIDITRKVLVYGSRFGFENQ